MVMGNDTGQKCIPVGCVPPALYLQGVSVTETPQTETPWIESPPPTQPVGRQTPVELLPFPKLRLRAVKMYITKS